MLKIAAFVVAVTFVLLGAKAQKQLVEKIISKYKCSGQIDLMIVVDGSYSVTSRNFQLIKKWIKDIAKGFHIDDSTVQIGVVQYSYWYRYRPMYRQKYIKTEITLGQYTNERSFNRAVDRIRYQGYKTFTAHAINKTVDYDFQSFRSRYPEARRAIILLTDGKATDAKDLEASVMHAERDAGVVIFAVGVGDYSIDELRIITNRHDKRIFELKNFTQLTNIVYELPESLQRSCDCSDEGSLNEECDPCTRKCVCKTNVVGRRCDKCAPGTYNISNSEGCLACMCNPLGTADMNTCDVDTGDCQCNQQSNIVGKRCDRCAEGMIGFPDCRPCQCNGFSANCTRESGVCVNCTGERAGDHCEKCRNGFHLSNSNVCVPCECNGNIDSSDSESCDSQTGLCLKCLHGTAGPHCENCADHHYRVPSGACHECECDVLGTIQSKCANGSCSCNTTTSQCPCLPNVHGLKCDRCDEGFWHSADGCKRCDCDVWGSISQSCNQKTGKCECMPQNKGEKCELCNYGHARQAQEDLCRLCTCDRRGTNSSSCPGDICSCEPRTAQCFCLSNVVGLSCEKCDDGFWNLGSSGGCEECRCHPQASVSPACNKLTGICECMLGNAGPKCDKCPKGYFKLKPADKCQECDCDMYGRDSSACGGGTCTCDPSTGQCPCLPHVTGRSCDRCEEGFYDLLSMQGCKSCDCHVNGSASMTCEKKTGQCDCKIGNVGKQCETCLNGYKRKDLNSICESETLNDAPEETEETTAPAAVTTNTTEKTPPSTTTEKTPPSTTTTTTTEKTSPSTTATEKTSPSTTTTEKTPPSTTTTTTTATTTEKTSPSTTTTTTATTTRRTLTTTRTPIRTFAPWRPKTFRPTPSRLPYLPTSTRSPIKTKSTGCYRCSPWPTYCYGWMCRVRWPHHSFTPAYKRCNYGNKICQDTVQRHYANKSGYRNNYSSTYSRRTTATTAPKRRTMTYGYNAYAQRNPGNYNYYIPYSSRQKIPSGRRSYTSSSRRSFAKPASYGLYKNVRG